MDQKIKRVTLEGEAFEAVKFEDSLCGQWLVKNFSEDDIYVSFLEEVDEDSSIKIPAGYFQICVANQNYGGLNAWKTDTIYIKGTGEVEVQQLCFQM